MQNVKCILFDLYNTLLDDLGLAEREKYRLDTIYTILEKSLYPVKFHTLADKYWEMTAYVGYFHHEEGREFPPFYQVEYLLNSLKVSDIVVFKKVYDVYTDAVLQIPPKPMKNAKKALEYIRDNGFKIGLISNTGKTPGVILRLLLKDLGLFEYFNDLVFSDEIGIIKPNPFIFHSAAERLRFKMEECLFIGDMTESDYKGALNAGMKGYLFNRDKDDLYELAVKLCGGYTQ